MADLESLLAAGNAAVKEGRWQEARTAFERACELHDMPEAHFGLGSALFWLGDLPKMVDHVERAYAGFRQRPDPLYASASAIRLAFHHGLHLANAAAAAGWIARATRLVDDHGLDSLRGELLLTRSCLTTEPKAAEDLARQALQLGRDSGDPDLELCALAQLGTTLVDQGRIAQGVELLDEAMAACVAGEASLETVAFTSCLTMVSCTNCAHFERATQWIRAMERFVQRHGSPFHGAECRIVHAEITLASGAWDDAERALKTAVDLAGNLLPNHRNDALATLADLRISQGRIEEAQRLLEGIEPSRRSVPVLARLAVALGHQSLAVALVNRRLELVGVACLESGRLLELLGEIELQSSAERAGERGRALGEVAEQHGCAILGARADRLHGRALLARGDALGQRLLDRALGIFARLGMPYEAALTRRALGEASQKTNAELARTEAQAALAAFEKLGARFDADATAALLRDLGVRTARSAARRATRQKGADALTQREQEVFALLGEALSNPEIASRLHVSRKTVEHHVAHVLSKLGLRSRAEAAAEAVRRTSGARR